MPNKTVHWTHDKLTRIQLLFITLCLVIAANTGIVGFIAINASENSNRALCGLKEGYQEDLHKSREFLAEPERYPQFNTPAIIKLTEAQSAYSEDRLISLSDIDC